MMQHTLLVCRLLNPGVFLTYAIMPSVHWMAAVNVILTEIFTASYSFWL